jgi:prevent-host-death family protein
VTIDGIQGREEREVGIEQARARLGPLARDAQEDDAVTWLTSHGRRIAAIVPPVVAELALRQEDGL